MTQSHVDILRSENPDELIRRVRKVLEILSPYHTVDFKYQVHGIFKKEYSCMLIVTYTPK